MDPVRRIAIPPLARWRDLPLLWRVGMALATAALFQTVAVLALDRSDPILQQWPAVFTTAVLFGLALSGCLYRLRRRITIEVTPDALTIVTAGPFGTDRDRRPRGTIADVHHNRIDGRAYLRLTSGHDVAIPLGPDPAAARQAFADLGAAPRAVSARTSPVDPSDGMPPGRSRSALIAVGIALTGGAVVVLPFAWPLSLILLFAAGIPIGIAVGTQPNKFWT